MTLEAEIADARAEMAFRARQLLDQTSYARLAGMPVNLLQARKVKALLDAAYTRLLGLLGST